MDTSGASTTDTRPRRRVGRFELFTEIASGGMATVLLGRVMGASDFARVVAIKRLHAHFAKDPVFAQMFLDEARVVARIRHPNVLPTIDLIEEEGELFIVMEYVEGETFAALMREARRRKERVPIGVSVRVMVGALHGLHAAHEATNERGELLNLVHRDVSPENIMIGTDGYPRLLDFGIARALGTYSQTREGEVKGKLAYMTPEQILGDPITRRTDVFSASVVLWQALTGRQLFKGKHVGEYTHKILYKAIDAPSYVLPDLPKKLDPIVLKGLEREPAQRWPTAQAMAEALESAGDMATQREVGVWVKRLAAERLSMLARKVAAVENAPRGATPASLPPSAPARAAFQSIPPGTDGAKGWRRSAPIDEPTSEDPSRSEPPPTGVPEAKRAPPPPPRHGGAPRPAPRTAPSSSVAPPAHPPVPPRPGVSKPPPPPTSEPPASGPPDSAPPEPGEPEPSSPGGPVAPPPPPVDAEADADLPRAADADAAAVPPDDVLSGRGAEQMPADADDALTGLRDQEPGPLVERLRALPPRRRMVLGGVTALAAVLVVVIVWSASGDAGTTSEPVGSAKGPPTEPVPTTSATAPPPPDAAAVPTTSNAETTASTNDTATDESDAAAASATTSTLTKGKGGGTPTGKRKPPSIYGRK